MKYKTLINQFLSCGIITYVSFILQPAYSQDLPLHGFYQNLHEVVQSEDGSPLTIAERQPPAVPAFNLENFKNKIKILQDGSAIGVLLNPVGLSYGDGKKSVEVFYSINLHSKNGIQKIHKLKSPELWGDTIIFSTNVPNVDMKVIPYKGFTKWEILTAYNLDYDSISVTINTRGPFYGGGERFLGSNLNGRTISNQHQNPPFLHGNIDKMSKNEYEPSYLQIPFILNPFGQGWYFDDAGSLFLTFDKEGKSFRVMKKGKELVFYSFQGSSPKMVLESYTRLVGCQPALPDWAYGVWINLLEGQDSILRKTTVLKEKGMPVTAIWLFDFDEPVTSTGWPFWSHGLIKDYRKVTDSIHSLGFKALTYLRHFSFENLLYYKFDNPMYGMYDSLGVLLHNQDELSGQRYNKFSDHGQYDFFNPAMGKIWEDIMHEILLVDNFDGWMEDFGDIGYYYDNELNNWNSFDYGLEYSLSNEEYVNLYSLVYHKLTYLLSGAAKSDVTTFSRSGFAGSAPFTRFVWAGDQHANWRKDVGYPSAITAGISIGLSGYANWAPDILCDSESRELWKRWVQFGAFTPLMRDHLWTNKPSAIDIWTDNESFQYFREYARVHMELVPYIQSAAKVYRETGTTIIRHMMLEFPDDKETYNCEYQYMFGTDYLVAPVVEEGATSKKVYFPEGEWKDFWSEKKIQSKGEWIIVPAPVDKIPVYRRLN